MYVKKDLIDGKFYQLEVQDTAGQEQFVLLREDYVLYSHGFLIVYSVAGKNAKKSLENVETYFNDIRMVHGESIPIMITASKIDLPRDISNKECHDMVNKLRKSHKNIEHIETSAKTPTNVSTAFQRLCQLVLREQGESGTSAHSEDDTCKCCTIL